MKRALHSLNQRGQMTIETMLLITIFLIVALTVQNRMIQQGWAKQLVEGPWTRVQGMIENGVWMAPAAGKKFHPSAFGRHGSLRGDDY